MPKDADYRDKGKFISDEIDRIDSIYKFDFVFPIDCDEFLFLKDVDGEPTCSRNDIFTYLEAFRDFPGALEIKENFLHILGHAGYFWSMPYQKVFFVGGNCESLDHGSHVGVARRSSQRQETSLAYAHFHFKPYHIDRNMTKEKLAPFVDVNDVNALRAFKGPGVHLVGHLFKTEAEYYASFTVDERAIYFSSLVKTFSLLGIDPNFASHDPEDKRAKDYGHSAIMSSDQDSRDDITTKDYKNSSGPSDLSTAIFRQINLEDLHIDDAVTSLPALYDLVDRQKLRLWFANGSVLNLWNKVSNNIEFSGERMDNAETLNTQIPSRFFMMSGLHMMQSWYWNLGMAVPPVVPAIHVNEASAVFGPDVIISPYSHGDLGLQIKILAPEKWNAVIRTLLGAGLTVGVCGAFRAGTDEKFWDDLPVSLLDSLPLPSLAGHLRGARCVVTVDNGIGHLAHMMGIPHVHMIPRHPRTCPKEWVMNLKPNADVIFEDFRFLDENRVLSGIFSVLSLFNPEVYNELNGDVKGSRIRPWHHYVHFGRAEGRKTRFE